MKRKQIFGFGLVSVLAAFISIIVISGCGDSSSTSYSYAGAGSYWTISNHNGSTATIAKYANSSSTSADFTVEVSIQALTTSGFEKLTATSVTGTGGPSVGDTAYGFAVPGLAYFLKPLDASDDQLIAMVAGGGCPSADYSMNWVAVKSAGDPSSASVDFFGAASWANATNTMTLDTKYNLTAFGSVTAGETMTATCSNGVTEFTGGVLYQSSNGGIVHTDPGGSNDGIIFGFTSTAISATSNLAGQWTGLLFDADEASGSQVKPITATLTDGGTSLTGTGTEWTDIEAGTQSSGGVTILLNNADNPSSGFITGTITDSTTGNIACQYTTSGSDKLLNCVGQSPDDNTKLFNFLMKRI